MEPTEAGETVFEGVLIAVGWDPSGAVADIGLMTLDETEYRIDAAAARANSLADHLRKRVLLSAVALDGRLIRVSRVEIRRSPRDLD